MPSGGASPLEDKEFEFMWEHFKNASHFGLEAEWLRWFVGGLTIDKMSVSDAAFAATVEWDL